MSQPEARISRNIMKALRADGVFCFKVWGSEHTMAGLPDVIACAGGAFLGLEVKIPGKKHTLSERQKYVHKLIEDSGGYVAVVSSVAEARIVLEELRATKRHGIYVFRQTDA